MSEESYVTASQKAADYDFKHRVPAAELDLHNLDGLWCWCAPHAVELQDFGLSQPTVIVGHAERALRLADIRSSGAEPDCS